MATATAPGCRVAEGQAGSSMLPCGELSLTRSPRERPSLVAVSTGLETVRPEIGRVTIFADNDPGELYWEKGGFYTEANRNKLGVSIDLSKPTVSFTLLWNSPD